MWPYFFYAVSLCELWATKGESLLCTEVRGGEGQTAKRGAAERQGPGGDFGKSSDGRAVRRGSSPDRAPARGDQPSPSPEGQRGAQGAAAGTESAQRRGPWGKAGLPRAAGEARDGACRVPGAPMPGPRLEPRQSLLCGRRCPLGARGQREREDAAGRGNMQSPAPQCWSFVPGGRHPPNPPAMVG